jgi:hypothetical protein
MISQISWNILPNHATAKQNFMKHLETTTESEQHHITQLKTLKSQFSG